MKLYIQFLQWRMRELIAMLSMHLRLDRRFCSGDCAWPVHLHNDQNDYTLLYDHIWSSYSILFLSSCALVF